MAVEATGTQTAVINTVHTLHQNTTEKTLILTVDLTNLTTASGTADVVILAIKQKVLTGGTEKQVWAWTYHGANVGSPVKVSIPVHSSYSVSFTLQQIAGTGRAFDWRVDSI